MKLLKLPSSCENLRGVFWRPNEQFIANIAQELNGKRVLEIFAGNGALAGLLSKAGVEIKATSILSGMDRHSEGLYYPVEHIDACGAVKKYAHVSDVLLICWPTVTDAVLDSLKIWGEGKDFLYIGEVTDYKRGHLGGCATDSFFENINIKKKIEGYCGNMLEMAFMGAYAPLSNTCEASKRARPNKA